MDTQKEPSHCDGPLSAQIMFKLIVKKITINLCTNILLLATVYISETVLTCYNALLGIYSLRAHRLQF